MFILGLYSSFHGNDGIMGLKFVTPIINVIGANPLSWQKVSVNTHKWREWAAK